MKQETDDMIMKWFRYSLLVVGSTFVVTGILFVAVIFYVLVGTERSMYPLFTKNTVRQIIGDNLLYVTLLVFAAFHIYFLLRQAARRVIKEKRKKIVLLFSVVFFVIMGIETLIYPIVYTNEIDYFRTILFFYFPVHYHWILSETAWPIIHLIIAVLLYVFVVIYALRKENKLTSNTGSKDLI